MASITIRNIESSLKQRLRVRAAEHQRSMEDEARDILRRALAELPAATTSLADAIQQRFAEVGGADDLVIAPRDPLRSPPNL